MLFPTFQKLLSSLRILFVYPKLVIISEYPTTTNNRDGAMQRISAIDQILSGFSRVYLDISFRSHLIPAIYIERGALIVRLNYILHFLVLLYVLSKAKLVYIHSACNALRIPYFRGSSAYILDAHGVIPEEMLASGKRLKARIFTWAESRAIRSSSLVITVSSKMTEHYCSKYSKYGGFDKYLLLPILPASRPSLPRGEVLLHLRSPKSIVYAGGVQPWQNIDLMLDACISASDYFYTFLTGFPDELKAIARSKGIFRLNCKSVRPSEVADYYLSHEYGFVLRRNDIVNQVACPTKLVEYMMHGVIPIMLHERIGDFGPDTIHSVSLDQLLSGDLPVDSELVGMRQHNFAFIDALFDRARISVDRLLDFVSRAQC